MNYYFYLSVKKKMSNKIRIETNKSVLKPIVSAEFSIYNKITLEHRVGCEKCKMSDRNCRISGTQYCGTGKGNNCSSCFTLERSRG